jgi:replicative DNA helicase
VTNRDRVESFTLEAERGVLGSIMLDSTVLREVVMLLAKEDFHHDAHRQVYGVMLDLHNRGEPVDLAGLAAGISHLKEQHATSGSGLLSELADSVPHAANGTYYAEIVRDKSIERQIRRCRYGDQEPSSG